MHFKDLTNQFYDYLKLERNYSNETLAAYRRDIKRLEEYLLGRDMEINIDNLTVGVIRSFVTHLGADLKLGSATLSRNISALKSFFKFLLTQEYIDNPMC